MQTYSDPSRAADPYTLPDVEVFYMAHDEFLAADPHSWPRVMLANATCDSWADESSESARRDAAKSLAGWYWHSCFPGCLPDGEPNGPFDSAEAAETDAQDWS